MHKLKLFLWSPITAMHGPSTLGRTNSARLKTYRSSMMFSWRRSSSAVEMEPSPAVGADGRGDGGPARGEAGAGDVLQAISTAVQRRVGASTACSTRITFATLHAYSCGFADSLRMPRLCSRARSLGSSIFSRLLSDLEAFTSFENAISGMARFSCRCRGRSRTETPLNVPRRHFTSDKGIFL